MKAAGAQRIVLSPYFLSAGLLTERVDAALDRLCPDALVAGLGAHPAVTDAVAELYAEATAVSRPFAGGDPAADVADVVLAGGFGTR